MNAPAMTPNDSRATARAAFLARAGWGDADCTLLAGDASFRKYWRITRGDDVRVLMDAPPEHENIAPFMHVTELLRTSGLRVAALEAHDKTEGWLLLEDLGDHLFTKLLHAQPEMERGMYEAAIDALVRVRESADAHDGQLPAYDQAVYLREAALLTDWFLPQQLGMDAAKELRAPYLSIWQQLLEKNLLQQHVLVHRDYHADNLLWQPQAQGILRVGMLDYQDALYGDAAYDMVSLLEDARRDVSAETVAHCLAHYTALTGESPDAFGARYALLGAQRNAKIIGIFARLAVRDGKQHYLKYLPRVWRHFERDLAHPELALLKTWVDQVIPPPLRALTSVNPAIGGIA